MTFACGLPSRNIYLFFTGDLNLDSREGKTLIHLEEVHGMQCLITKPTRITSTTD